MWFIGVEVEQETISAPLPKKNPGSAPVIFISSGDWHCYVGHGTVRKLQRCKCNTKSESHLGMKLALMNFLLKYR